MSEYDRLVDILENLCKFCPVCGNPNAVFLLKDFLFEEVADASSSSD